MPELRIGILTCSDSRVAEGGDEAGLGLMHACEERGWYVIGYHVCPHDTETICASLIDLADADEADVVFTIGGTGLGPDDVAPEATERCVERIVPGIAQAIRSCEGVPKTEHLLSRATAGVRDRTLVINLPGGVERTLDSFEVVAEHLQAAKEALNPDDEAEAKGEEIST